MCVSATLVLSTDDAGHLHLLHLVDAAVGWIQWNPLPVRPGQAGV